MASDKPKVNVESSEGRTEIEVVDDDPRGVAKDLLDAMEATVGDVNRIYIEMESVDAAESEPLDNWGDISEGTAIHAVASVLKKHGPMTVTDVASRIDDYPKSTVSSALTNGKAKHIFERDAGPEGAKSRWMLTDWGYESVAEVGEYE